MDSLLLLHVSVVDNAANHGHYTGRCPLLFVALEIARCLLVGLTGGSLLQQALLRVERIQLLDGLLQNGLGRALIRDDLLELLVLRSPIFACTLNGDLRAGNNFLELDNLLFEGVDGCLQLINLGLCSFLCVRLFPGLIVVHVQLLNAIVLFLHLLLLLLLELLLHLVHCLLHLGECIQLHRHRQGHQSAGLCLLVSRLQHRHQLLSQLLLRRGGSPRHRPLLQERFRPHGLVHEVARIIIGKNLDCCADGLHLFIPSCHPLVVLAFETLTSPCEVYHELGVSIQRCICVLQVFTAICQIQLGLGQTAQLIFNLLGG
mmetsp:Transcript_30933/g.67888  ORF Transcript_30933/g.67888 Transcript_30933/m.67888 type:complete len:317 (-) Transcript_30933:962-1912(-)